MIVCIAEKPSVAKEIATVIGAKTRKNGYLEGNGYQVTWTFGHLCTLKEPHDYHEEWKRWTLSQLPMLPKRFGIKLIDDPGIQKQFEIIRQLVTQADEIINCGDAGQEGELIQRWVLQKAGCKCKISRLWISSLTEDAIREGFDKLHESNEFDTLYQAGMARAIGDWMLGINVTRLYTLKYRKEKQVLSIGRVQTPTLALIVQRQHEIENFIPQPYWELKTLYSNTTFSAKKGRFQNEEEGKKQLEKIKGHPLTITAINTKEGKETPPHLFDLTSLQVECNKKYAFSAEETLKHIQTLYEKKLTTYPRVDTTYLSDDIYPKITNILRGLIGYEEYTTQLLQLKKIPKSKKVFDNTKVTDHHAIIPTGIKATNIAGPEAQIYDLVVRRFIAAFYPDCKMATTTIEAESAGVEFKVTGKQILEPGWKTLYAKDNTPKEESENNNEELLPPFKKGETGPHQPTLIQKMTQPPKPYTEATLLRTMETAGKLVENEELRDLLKENGIGRPSTRAAIIETLNKRNYIKKVRKNLIATPIGIELIANIQEELLKSAELTGIWEKKLREIEKGKYDPILFLDELKKMVSKIIYDTKYKPIENAPQTKLICPLCKKGQILKGKKAYGCSNWKEGCNFRLPFEIYGDTNTAEELKNIIHNYSHYDK